MTQTAPLASLDAESCKRFRGLLTDIDDTLTTDGVLTAVAYDAWSRAAAAGLLVIPVTGRPAGWADHIARMWPVDGVVAENGALYMRHTEGRMIKETFLTSEEERTRNRERLRALGEEILEKVPGTALASDQAYREFDIAIDYREDVPALSSTDVDKIVGILAAHHATARVSSIHVNGWFGTYDKLSMTKRLMRDVFDVNLDNEQADFVFVGDSANDSPMFEFFENAVGVANIVDFAGHIEHSPAYVTEQQSGAGFQELARALLVARTVQ